jgi:hypothetical protein
MDRGWRRAVKRGGWIATGLGSVWFIAVKILDNLARLSMARDIVIHLRALIAFKWTPLGIFVTGVLVLAWLHFHDPTSAKNDISTDLPITPADPRVYVEVIRSPTSFWRTQFLLHNQGEDTAHDVCISPFKLCGRLVTFPSVGAINSGACLPAMPTVEKCFGGITQHDIFYWLSKAWRDKHDLMEECITPICINYRDSMDGKHFEATMTLVFDAIRYQLNKERDVPDESSVCEFKNILFKRIK